MSYLSGPRLCFNGYFQADVSTVNNDVRYYDTAHFKEQYQLPSSSGVSPNGAWQPEGSGIFRFVDCAVTGGWLDGAAVTADPALGLSLENSDQRVSGKLADLDPQQQLVSEIWGMSLRLTDAAGPAYLNGRYAVAAFINAWLRQKEDSAPNDQKIGAAYQSVLEDVAWSDDAGRSPLLRALREASEDGLPLKGVPPPAQVAPETLRQETVAAPTLDLEPIQRGGKTEFLLQLQARKNMEKGG